MRSPRTMCCCRRTEASGARSIHVEDICRAFLAVLEAPREAVHNEAFNVGSTAENYRIRDVAEIVQRLCREAASRFRGKSVRTSATIG